MPASDPGGGQYDGKKMNYPTWWIDPDYEDDLHDQSLHADVAHTALLMQLQYPLGPMQIVAAGETERFFKVFLMIWDSDDLERRRCDLIKRTTHLPRDFLLRIYDLPRQALAMTN